MQVRPSKELLKNLGRTQLFTDPLDKPSLLVLYSLGICDEICTCAMKWRTIYYIGCRSLVVLA